MPGLGWRISAPDQNAARIPFDGLIGNHNASTLRVSPGGDPPNPVFKPVHDRRIPTHGKTPTASGIGPSLFIWQSAPMPEIPVTHAKRIF
jgi:hypothetical protein